MLQQIDLELFKCFEILRLPLAPLTLLSGGNAAGKSSVLQALVLLHQTIHEHEWSTRLMLNGPFLRMGTVTDIVDKVNGRSSCGIGLIDDDNWYRWEFAGDRSEMSMAILYFEYNKRLCELPKQLQYMVPSQLFSDPIKEGSLPYRLRDLTYITAERVGPREFYPLQDQRIAKVVGPAGEYAGSVLYQGRDEEVLPGLVIPEVPNTRLRQVIERMRTFFPGFRLDVQRIEQTNSVRLGIRTSDETDYHRPIHVGFGLTQVLPIVIAALSASAGDILLIENPEVHLHPAGQALMGQFLGEVVNAGVQVIAETHSDHVLNGVRRAVKAKRLAPENVALHFFRPRSPIQNPDHSEDFAQVVSPQIDANGNIDHWPDGFFDQFDKDSNYFAGWGE